MPYWFESIDYSRPDIPKLGSRCADVDFGEPLHYCTDAYKLYIPFTIDRHTTTAYNSLMNIARKL